MFDAATRNPVANATVHWLGTARTNARGEYRIEPGCGRNFGFGTITIQVTHPGYSFPFTVGGRAEGFATGAIRRRDLERIPHASLAHIMSGGDGAGVGIAGMRERIDQLGGRFEIASGDHGTTVRARVPLVKDAA